MLDTKPASSNEFFSLPKSIKPWMKVTPGNQVRIIPKMLIEQNAVTGRNPEPLADIEVKGQDDY
jgi:hypothetical protein